MYLLDIYLFLWNSVSFVYGIYGRELFLKQEENSFLITKMPVKYIWKSDYMKDTVCISGVS